MRIKRVGKQIDVTNTERNPWLPGWRRTPVLGTGALVLSVLGIIFPAIVLAVSDGETLEAWNDRWSFSPTVYLSIASTIVNITLSYAFTVGGDIYWWQAALSPNTTITTLHRAWKHGNSFLDAIISLRHVNLIAIACIVVTLTPVNGPLLQQASRVRARDAPIRRTLDISIADQLPRNYSGYLVGRGQVLLYNSNFSNVVREYSNQIPIQLQSSCETDCRSTVLASGWAVDCETSYIPYNMTALPAIPYDEANGSYVPNFAEVFQSSVEWNGGLPSVLQAGAQIKPKDGCTGDLLQRNCTLAAATVEYPVRLTRSTISLEPGSTIWGDAVIGPVTNVSHYEVGQSTWGGLAFALQNQYNSFMIAYYDPIWGYQTYYDGTAAHTYIAQSSGSPDCSIIFRDPMDDILSSARELMFRAAVSVGATDDSYMQKLTATETVSQNVYESEYLFLGLATALSVLGILSVVVTFNGFWTMGRKVSLNPIETAKAFDAPLLRSHDSNAPIETLLREVGARRVRYGALNVDQKAISESGSAKCPTLPPISATYREIPWRVIASTSTERNQQLYHQVPLIDDEIEMQEPAIRHAHSSTQTSTTLVTPSNGTQEHFPPSKGGNLQGSAHVLRSGSPETEKVDDQHPLLRLQLSSPELIQPPIAGLRYTG